jgi:hypothetical protein
MDQKIRAILIIEVAGRPPAYLVESITKHVEKIGTLQGIKLISSKIAEPRKIDEEKDLYTSFAEAEVETETLGKLMDLVFDFMPSSVEIIDPVEITFDTQEATMLFNDLSGRLHKYDEVVKVARMQIQQLSEKLMEAQGQKKVVAPVIQPLQITMDNPEPKKSKNNSSKKSKKKK